ncbi:thiolase family protein [Arthrobacter psychrochitiniphilus]|uniref:thiolase family protein n=1 Tax=Arthrobacter psychrochitiniphilus TaxID=291045 RepID=UPI0017E27FA9|nr:thiolase family protein [Arthrobacter psychrochitiniphilus]NYG17105.1 acetyl-CoA C-acetyltransferase [Arthrobacter psychrochitiniphilus]
MPDAGHDGIHNDPRRTPVVLLARRLPNAKAGGAYKNHRAHDLAAAVISHLVMESGINPLAINDVILGNATGGGGNVARLAALTAGLAESVPGLSVDRQCGSGLEAIILACRLIQAGAGELYLAGGVESISTAPARAHRNAEGALEFYDRAQFAPLATGDPDAGVAAENVARHYGITRARQDAYAMESHTRALAAQRNAAFASELVPFADLAADQGIRGNLNARLMARFPPAFVAGGSVTAGNSCPFSDGAAVAVVTSLEHARTLVAAGDTDTGASVGLAFRASAVAGNDPNLLGVGAARAMELLLASTGLGIEQVRHSRVEFNEAFAAQVLAVADLLDLDPVLFNHDGGALALGHPYGASGAVLVTRLLAQVQATSQQTPEAKSQPALETGSQARAAAGQDAFAMLSMAGGMGLAAHFQTVDLRPQR